MHGFKRWLRRMAFVWGSRTVRRDPEERFIFPVHRKIVRTGKVKGKRLALKEPFAYPKEKVRAREAVWDYHRSITPKSYVLTESKRYPSIRGMRTELYYDRPSLLDLMEQKRNRRVRAFLRTNGLTIQEAGRLASQVYDEVERNFLRAQVIRVGISVDVKPDQFLVDKMEPNGKMKIILVDI